MVLAVGLSLVMLGLGRFGGLVLLDAVLGGYEKMLPNALQTYPEQAYDGPFYQLRSPIRNISRVRVPTFIVGGTYDICYGMLLASPTHLLLCPAGKPCHRLLSPRTISRATPGFTLCKNRPGTRSSRMRAENIQRGPCWSFVPA